MQLRLLNGEALSDIPLERQHNNNSKTIRNNGHEVQTRFSDSRWISIRWLLTILTVLTVDSNGMAFLERLSVATFAQTQAKQCFLH